MEPLEFEEKWAKLIEDFGFANTQMDDQDVYSTRNVDSNLLYRLAIIWIDENNINV